jgi:hypothetical protein
MDHAMNDHEDDQDNEPRPRRRKRRHSPVSKKRRRNPKSLDEWQAWAVEQSSRGNRLKLGL